MPTKVKTIKLSYPQLNPHGTPTRPDYLYRVEQITDSTDFVPKQMLTKAQVDELCACRDWKVTVVGSSMA